jgi:hypothetical protein
VMNSLSEAELSKCFVLHIGKTGGTFLRQVLSTALKGELQRVKLLSHQFSLRRAFKEFPRRKAVFTVRDPTSLFVSAFNSRLRMGQPRYHVEWSRAEAIAFDLFRTPKDLAEALSSEDSYKKSCAKFAMLNIVHVRSCLKDYLLSVDYLEAVKDRIGYILTQETLDLDVKGFAQKIGMDISKATSVQDEVERHATPAQFSRDLSELARNNLAEWYNEDGKIYEWCLINKNSINSL